MPFARINVLRQAQYEWFFKPMEFPSPFALSLSKGVGSQGRLRGRPFPFQSGLPVRYGCPGGHSPITCRRIAISPM
jgi:hypothetical protein